jgi:hypothetical protein
MRAAGAEGAVDIADIRRLGAIIGVANVSDALGIVMGYYPASRISPKTRFGLEEILGNGAKAE